MVACRSYLIVMSSYYLRNKGLLTEYEVCTGKYLPEVFVQTEQTRLIRHLLYGFWFIFFSVYSAVFVFRCCRLPYVRACWFRFMFTLVGHSFASLIDKELSRKPTLMFQDVLLFEPFQRTYLILFYFHFKWAQEFSRQKSSVLPTLYISHIYLTNTRITFSRAFACVLISNTMTLGKLVIKCPRKPREDLWKSQGH